MIEILFRFYQLPPGPVGLASPRCLLLVNYQIFEILGLWFIFTVLMK